MLWDTRSINHSFKLNKPNENPKCIKSIKSHLVLNLSVLLVCVFVSQAVVVDRTMYISGQLGLDVASGQLVDGGVQAQAKQVSHEHASHTRSLTHPQSAIISTVFCALEALINMGEILKAAGCDYTNGEAPSGSAGVSADS